MPRCQSSQPPPSIIKTRTSRFSSMLSVSLRLARLFTMLCAPPPPLAPPPELTSGPSVAPKSRFNMMMRCCCCCCCVRGDRAATVHDRDAPRRPVRGVCVPPCPCPARASVSYRGACLSAHAAPQHRQRPRFPAARSRTQLFPRQPRRPARGPSKTTLSRGTALAGGRQRTLLEGCQGFPQG